MEVNGQYSNSTYYLKKLILNSYPKRTLSTTFNKNLKVKLSPQINLNTV